MVFDTSVIAKMPEKSHRTFDSLIRAWNKANEGQDGFTPLDPLKKGDRRKLTFDGEGLKVMKSQESIKKALNLFTRLYNQACAEMTVPEPATKKSKTSRSTSRKKSAEKETEKDQDISEA